MRELEQRLLIVDDVEILDARPHLRAVHADDFVTWLITLAVTDHSHCVCNHVQFLKVDQVVMKGFISLVDKGDVF